MKKVIKIIIFKFEDVKKIISNLMKLLIIKVMVLEKLKFCVIQGIDLEVYMKLYMIESEDEEEEELFL